MVRITLTCNSLRRFSCGSYPKMYQKAPIIRGFLFIYISNNLTLSVPDNGILYGSAHLELLLLIGVHVPNAYKT